MVSVARRAMVVKIPWWCFGRPARCSPGDVHMGIARRMFANRTQCAARCVLDMGGRGMEEPYRLFLTIHPSETSAACDASWGRRQSRCGAKGGFGRATMPRMEDGGFWPTGWSAASCICMI